MPKEKDWTDQLVRWFLQEARDLPWRRTYDPYHIFLSEVMLQQTQVATVLPYYARFLNRFPTFQSLAEGTESEVLSLWSGLGYYSRARNLLKAAQEVFSHHGGKFPLDKEALLKIPGIGPYTAGAILSIAFEKKIPLVDGNVFRVYSRFFGIRTPINVPATQKEIWKKASEIILNVQKPRAFNQALMELGSLVCVKDSPRCEDCPISYCCVALKKGWHQELPVKVKKDNKKVLYWLLLIFQQNEKLFLRQNKDTRWWKDLWDLPRYEFDKKEAMEKKIVELSKIFSLRVLPRKKHQVTHHAIHLLPLLVQEKNSKDLTFKKLTEAGSWVSRERLETLAKSSLVSKALGSLGSLEI